MSYPKVSFQLNKPLDKRMAIEFLSSSAGGIDFSRGIFGPHPGIKRSIFRYIDDFYATNELFLNKKRIIFETEWRRKESAFFHYVDSIFHHRTWPPGEYIGYVSIFDCNPRFLENKTFQIFYRHKLGPAYVTAHELLHFMFYDYIQKRRKELIASLGDEGLWRISEIVNEVLLGLPPLSKIFKVGVSSGYPAFQYQVRKLKKQLKKVDSIDTLLKLAIKFR